MAHSGQLEANEAELEMIVRNIILISTFWLAFDQVLERESDPRPGRAVAQVMSVVSPYLKGRAKTEMLALASAYR